MLSVREVHRRCLSSDARSGIWLGQYGRKSIRSSEQPKLGGYYHRCQRRVEDTGRGFGKADWMERSREGLSRDVELAWGHQDGMEKSGFPCTKNVPGVSGKRHIFGNQEPHGPFSKEWNFGSCQYASLYFYTLNSLCNDEDMKPHPAMDGKKSLSLEIHSQYHPLVGVGSDKRPGWTCL